MGALVHLSPYHFARQFKAATGLPPHQYVITRRVERAQQLLRADGELGLAEVAFRSGFANQSHFCFQTAPEVPPTAEIRVQRVLNHVGDEGGFAPYFKRTVGVTRQQFRAPVAIR